ncbi:hypothetical protein K439DRAFT_1613458 [Ramaria rubella]|nr:hypothetical protein K439DRAFT_1613458 [Ramaria rubella]
MRKTSEQWKSDLGSNTYRHKEPLRAIVLALELPDNGTIPELQLCIKACLEERRHLKSEPHFTGLFIKRRVHGLQMATSVSEDPNLMGPSEQADTPAPSTSSTALPPSHVFMPLSLTPEAVTIIASHHTGPQVAQPFHPSPSDPMSLLPPTTHGMGMTPYGTYGFHAYANIGSPSCPSSAFSAHGYSVQGFQQQLQAPNSNPYHFGFTPTAGAPVYGLPPFEGYHQVHPPTRTSTSPPPGPVTPTHTFQPYTDMHPPSRPSIADLPGPFAAMHAMHIVQQFPDVFSPSHPSITDALGGMAPVQTTQHNHLTFSGFPLFISGQNHPVGTFFILYNIPATFPPGPSSSQSEHVTHHHDCAPDIFDAPRLSHPS